MTGRLVLSGFLVAGMLAGCNSPGSNSTSAPAPSTSSSAPSVPAPTAPASGGKSLVVISPALTSVFHQELVDGAKAESSAKGWTFSHIEPDKETNSAQQVSQVQDSLQRGVNAISICAVNDEALVQSIKKANDARVPIFVHNSITPVPKGNVVAYIGYDERDGGRKCGLKAVELLKAKYGTAKGKVAILDGTAGTHTDQRAGGFKDALQGTQIKVVAEQSANWVRKEGADRTAEFLQKYPDLDLVFGCSDAMAQGAAQAAQQAGKKIYTIGLDGNPDALQDIKKGTLTATLVVFPRKMGRQIVDAINAYHPGQPTGKVIKTATQVVDAKTVNQVLAGKGGS